jgi:hypothetical protein
VKAVLLLFYLYLVQRLQVGISGEEDPSLDKVRKCFRELIFSEDMGGYAENLVELLER